MFRDANSSGKLQIPKRKVGCHAFRNKKTLSVLQQKNQDFDAKEKLVERLEIELAQHKADVMLILQDSEVLKASSDEIKSNIQSLGEELVNGKHIKFGRTH